MHDNQEADSFEHNRLPYDTDTHYEFTENPPGHTPPMSSSFLLRRFKDPLHCGHSNLILKQCPKRKDRRPRRGDAEDGNIAWGIYLQDFISPRRICFAFSTCFLVCFLFGLSWAIWKGSIQDGFSVSAFVFTGVFSTVAAWQFGYHSVDV